MQAQQNQGPSWQPCAACGGGRRCPNCGGTGGNHDPNTPPCAGCGGSGLCRICNGAGGRMA